MTLSTKTALMDAGEQAARQRGYDGFSYADLARAVGIRKASVHHHFPAKADLIVAMVDRYHAVVERECADIDAAHQRANDKAAALVQFYRSALHQGDSLCLCVALSTSSGHLPDPVVSGLNKFRMMILAWLETVFETATQDNSIRRVGPPAAEAAALLAMLEGAQLAARANGSVAPFTAALALFQSRLD